MNKIAAALVKAQKGFAPALKSSSNPHFKSKYADLAACVEAVVDSLNDNGIALIQKQHPNDGGVCVETLFVHESGEVFSAGMLTVPASKQDPQGYGSALTYARRYSLMAACGIAPEDDDGNAASKAGKDTKQQPERTRVMKVANAIKRCLADGLDMGALQEWELACDVSEDFAGLVWSSLSTPERDKVRSLRDEARKVAA